MTHSRTNRTAAGTVLAALALGIAAPAASTRPFDLNQQVSDVRPASAHVYVPPASLAPHLARVTPVYVPPSGLAPRVAPGTPRAQHSTGSGTSVWEFVAVGSGAAALTLIGVGGTRAASRRRQRTASAPSVSA